MPRPDTAALHAKDDDPDGSRTGADDLLSEVHILASLISRAFAGALDRGFGMSVAEWRVMMTLHRHPGLTAAGITSRWAMDKMAISRAIQRLQTAGYIRRDRNPDDRRSYRLSLTDSGMALHRRILPMANERYRAFLSCLSRDEAATLRQALGKLIAQAENFTD
jgi:DNA-binding MarR family transcriptional regulator